MSGKHKNKPTQSQGEMIPQPVFNQAQLDFQSQDEDDFQSRLFGNFKTPLITYQQKINKNLKNQKQKSQESYHNRKKQQQQHQRYYFENLSIWDKIKYLKSIIDQLHKQLNTWNVALRQTNHPQYLALYRKKIADIVQLLEYNKFEKRRLFINGAMSTRHINRQYDFHGFNGPEVYMVIEQLICCIRKQNKIKITYNDYITLSFCIGQESHSLKPALRKRFLSLNANANYVKVIESGYNNDTIVLTLNWKLAEIKFEFEQ